MKVLIFGSFDPQYSRNSIIIEGLKSCSVEVFQCRPVRDIQGIISFDRTEFKHALHYDYDLILLAYPNHHYKYINVNGFLTRLLRKLKNVPIISDPFATTYEVEVIDWKSIPAGSWKAKWIRLNERNSFEFPHLILTDTQAHAHFYSRDYQIPLPKFKRLFVGCNDRLYFPKNTPPHEKFKVFFFGSYQPLQGIPTILKAADLLKLHSDIEFEIIGGSYNNKIYADMKRYQKSNDLQNVTLKSIMSEQDLINEMYSGDLCLGIFGNTFQSKIVIPNKAFATIAMKKPLITANTPAIRELFTHNENAWLCEPRADALANAIVQLKEDAPLRKKLAENGYRTFLEKCSPTIIGKELRNIISEIV